MTVADERQKKRHWFLASWSVPQPGAFVPLNAYVWSRSRSITIPVLNAARDSRKLPETSVLTNVSYLGWMNEYELTGKSPDPVATVTSAAYTMGLEQVLTVPDPLQLINAFEPADQFNFAEWQRGYDFGAEMRKKIVSLSARPPGVQ